MFDASKATMDFLRNYMSIFRLRNFLPGDGEACIRDFFRIIFNGVVGY